jgi:hypothetical protein
MVTTLNFKIGIDLPEWRPLAAPQYIGSTTGYGLISDLRNNIDRHPYFYRCGAGAVVFDIYNPISNQWIIRFLNSPALASAYTSGFFMPSQGPRGTIAAGATTSLFTLTTVLPANVGVNQLANRGDGRGFKVRIIGNSAGSSGKTEERIVIGNTGETTTPTIILDNPLSFSPLLGDTYEFLSGKVYTLGASNAVGSWKYYDILTNSFSGNLSIVFLPATWTSSNMVGLDELLVPYDRSPGEGFLGNLVATGSGAATLTGQAVGGDAALLANQYRNFQLRIIQDIGTPTAVGQRRNITSHTAGASPVYTVPAWTVQPSANATYVIENNGNRILVWTNANTNTNTYHINAEPGFAADTWDTTTFAVKPVGSGGFTVQSFSLEPDPATNARHSFMFSPRADTNITFDLFDISGAATGVWTSNITYGNHGTTNTGAGYSHIQDPATMQGRYVYYRGAVSSGTGFYSNQSLYRFDMKNRVQEPYTTLRVPVSAYGVFAYASYIDGNTKLSYIYNDVQNNALNAQFLFSLPIIV